LKFKKSYDILSIYFDIYYIALVKSIYQKKGLANSGVGLALSLLKRGKFNVPYKIDKGKNCYEK